MDYYDTKPNLGPHLDWDGVRFIKERDDDAVNGWESVRLIKSAQRLFERGRRWQRQPATTLEMFVAWIVVAAFTALGIWAVLITR